MLTTMEKTRRSFIKHSAAALAFSSIGFPSITSAQKQKPWRVALIGTGWYGKSDLFKLIQVASIEVVGLSDVDNNHLQEAAVLVQQRQSNGKKPNLYNRYKELLEKEKPEIVLIGTPDHWHALMAIDAIKSGAHIYLQKPVSLDVIEGEAVLAAARKYNKVVQIGTQRRSTPHLERAKQEIVESGELGKVSHVEMCCYYHMRANDNPPLSDIPDFLDYDYYTGPTSYRPYDKLPHRGWWRAFTEYSNGIMGDMCVHMFDAVRWNLGLGWPESITSSGGIYVQKSSKSNTSDTQTAIFQYPELNCVWNHRSWGAPVDPAYPWAYFIYGDKGTLKADVFGFDFIPRGKKEGLRVDVTYEKDQYPEDLNEKGIELHTAPATRAHMLDFLRAIENQTLPVADIEQGHISSACCILANLSMDLGRPLTYNPKNLEVLNDEEATQRLTRKYRDGWNHPHPDTV